MLLDRLISLFRNDPPPPVSADVKRTSLDLDRAIERAAAVADHVTITAGVNRRRSAALTLATEEVAQHMREVWGPQ